MRKDGMCVPNDQIEPVCSMATKEMCRRVFECMGGTGQLPWRNEEDCVAEMRDGCIGASACPGVIFHADQAQRCIDAIMNATCEELMQEESPVSQECSTVTEGERQNQRRSDWDCESGFRCENGRCVQAFCRENWECREGEQCVDGICQPGQWCRSDRDCPPEQRCVNGQCVFAGCAGDWDCPEGQRRLDGRCLGGPCASDGDCMEGQFCAEGACAPDPRYGALCPVGFVCDRASGGCVEQGAEQFCHLGSDCPEGSLCALGVDPGSNGVCVKKPAEDAAAFVLDENGAWQPANMDLSCYAQQPQEEPGSADVSGEIAYFGPDDGRPAEYKVSVSLLDAPENPIMELMVTGETFTAANMPTGTPLVFKVYAEGLANTYLWNVTIKAAAPAIKIPALSIIQFLNMPPDGRPLPESSGLIIGQVFDCAGATIKGATASAAHLDGGLAYFAGDADWTVDTGLAATSANGLYMGYGATPGQAVTAVIARFNGSIGSLGFKSLTVFPVSAMFVRFGK